MDFIEKIQDIAQRIPKQIDHIQTEEATKSAFVMPFIQAMGYDVFNPMEVIPEFVADHGTKKGEKVDYAIKIEDKIGLLVECKWCGANLDQCHASQLFRYFSCTDARFAILTNGIYYKFFSDLDEKNKMDVRPFFEFDLLAFDEDKVAELKKFTKSAFDLDNILNRASELKYTGAIKQIFRNELNSPSADFIRFFASQVYSGRLTQLVLDQFSEIVKRATSQVVREKVNNRLKTALDADQDEGVESAEAKAADEDEFQDEGAETDSAIVTTDEEKDAFNIIRAIGREVVDVGRIAMRDRVRYCGVLLDDNNRKPICRFHFNTKQKYIGLFTQKDQEKVPIDDLNDIFKYADRIKATINEYLAEG